METAHYNTSPLPSHNITCPSVDITYGPYKPSRRSSIKQYQHI